MTPSDRRTTPAPLGAAAGGRQRRGAGPGQDGPLSHARCAPARLLFPVAVLRHARLRLPARPLAHAHARLHAQSPRPRRLTRSQVPPRHGRRLAAGRTPPPRGLHRLAQQGPAARVRRLPARLQPPRRSRSRHAHACPPYWRQVTCQAHPYLPYRQVTRQARQAGGLRGE